MSFINTKSKICEHGSLKRQCELCFRDTEINILEQEIAHILEALNNAINELCSCGGSGRNDEYACDICKLSHQFKINLNFLRRETK